MHLTQRRRATQEAAPTPGEIFRATAPDRVLVAEDDDELRSLIVSALERDGYDVIEARNGMQLLRYIGGLVLSSHPLDPPDLIISDNTMPGLDGLDALSGLRRADWYMPFVLITALDDSATRAEAMRRGASLVLGKPLDLDALRRAVGGLVPRVG